MDAIVVLVAILVAAFAGVLEVTHLFELVTGTLGDRPTRGDDPPRA